MTITKGGEQTSKKTTRHIVEATSVVNVNVIIVNLKLCSCGMTNSPFFNLKCTTKLFSQEKLVEICTSHSLYYFVW